MTLLPHIKRHGKHALLFIIILIIAWIVLPTGTPEDLITTFVFIKVLGLVGYAVLALIVLLLVWFVLPKSYRRRIF